MLRGIILSGGWGTRLRPLTCVRPKTLIPVVNKPVIERQILHLKTAGVKEVVLAVSVMADDLKKYFGDGERLGIKIIYTEEKHPLGTAGAIKLAEEYLKDDDFFMLNGDVIFNFDFNEIVAAHKKFGGTGVIASKIVDDPSRYGVLITEEKTNRIIKFLEKDEYKLPKDGPVPMPINAGIYLLKPEIFSYIEPNKRVSIEKEVFPKIAEEGKLFHYPIKGIWKDMGKPEELLDANFMLLRDLIEKLPDTKNLIDPTFKIEENVKINAPVAIGANTIIKSNSTIGPNVVIGNNVYIGENTIIKDSLIYDDVYIENNVLIDKAIISDNCYINSSVELRGKNQSLVILSSCVEVLEGKKIKVSTDKHFTVCHHEVVK